MSTQNRWQIGVMYRGGLLNGQPFFTQPDGPGTAVFPTERQGEPWVDFPIQGMVWSEKNPWQVPGCLHSIKAFDVQREYDYDNNVSVALLLCPTCSYCQRAISPFEEWLNPIQNAIIIG